MISAEDREPVLDFRILGPVEIYADGRRISVGGGKQRTLLAILVLNANESVSTDRLVDALWGGDPPTSAANSVYVYVSQLRKQLGNGMLVTRGRGYSLEVDPVRIDAHRFEELMREGSGQLLAGDPEGAARTLRDALALWRGPPLAEFAYEDFAQAEIERLQALRLAALEDRIDADLASGRSAALVPELEALVREHPLRERLRGQLMVALYRDGRQAQALEVYREGRRALADELGLDPGPRLRELERQILTQDPALDLERAEPKPLRGPLPSPRIALALAVSAALLLAVVATAVFELNRSGAAGLASLAPNSVGVIDPQRGRIVAQIPTGLRPGQLVAGEGAVWVANLGDESISRIDPDANALARTISTGVAPTGLAVDDGRVWVAGSDASLSRIDPQYNRLTRVARLGEPAYFRHPLRPALAAGFGSIWMADPIGQVNRVDRSTGAIASTVDVGRGASSIAIGAGSVWVANTLDGTVSRVDPTGVVTATIPVGHGPTGVAFGEGRLWVAVPLDGVVTSIDPATNAVESRILAGDRPDAVVVGLGAVWVADARGGRVFGIDPASGEIEKTIDLGSSPGGLAIVGDSLWVTAVPLAAVPAGGAMEEGTLRVEVEQDPGVLDPALAKPDQLAIWYATCAKLVNYPDAHAPAGARLVPEVAESMPAVSADGRRYTFTVRPGFRFSPPSNEPVTAQTFKDTIERTLHSRMGSGVTELADIVGASAYSAGRAKHISGLTVRGNKLVIRLTRPAGDLPARLSMPYFCAVPSGTPVDPNGVEGIPMAGPYYIASHVPGQTIVLERNPSYGGERPQGPTEIQYTIGVSEQRTLANVLAGKADYAADGVPLGAQRGLTTRLGPGSPAAERRRQQFFVNPFLGMFYFALNTKRPLLADPRVRQAVSYAVDRAALARVWNQFFKAGRIGGGPPTADYLPPGMRVSSKRVSYPLRPDPARARSLMNGKRGTAVLFTCNTPPCPQQAAILERNLAAIGIDLVVKAFPVGVLFARAYEPDAPYDLVRLGWLTDRADPAAVLEPLLRSGQASNLSHVADLDQRLDAAAKLTGPARERAYDRLARQIAEDSAPLIAFESVTSRDLFSERVGCQIFNPVYGIDLAALCLR